MSGTIQVKWVDPNVVDHVGHHPATQSVKSPAQRKIPWANQYLRNTVALDGLGQAAPHALLGDY